MVPLKRSTWDFCCASAGCAALKQLSQVRDDVPRPGAAIDVAAERHAGELVDHIKDADQPARPA